MNRGHEYRHARPYPVNRGFSSGTLAVLLLFVASLAGSVWVSMGIVTAQRWPIRWLELEGSFDRVSAEQLRSSLAPMVDASFFTVDLEAVRDAALRNSWVAEVSVQKKWPDTVLVTVHEHAPVAHWNSGQLISDAGRMFAAPGADEIQGLPWLSGPDERLAQVLDQWVRFNLMLDRASLEIERLALDQRGAWSMQVNKGTWVQLGREDADERLERLMISWSTLLRHHELPPVRVDLRYTNGFAIRWPVDATEFAGNER